MSGSIDVQGWSVVRSKSERVQTVFRNSAKSSTIQKQQPRFVPKPKIQKNGDSTFFKVLHKKESSTRVTAATISLSFYERLLNMLDRLPRELIDIVLVFRGSLKNGIDNIQSLYDGCVTRFNDDEFTRAMHDYAKMCREFTTVPERLKALNYPSWYRITSWDTNEFEIRKPNYIFWNNSWNDTCVHLEVQTSPFEQCIGTKNSGCHLSDWEGSDLEKYPLSDFTHVRPSSQFSLRSCVRYLINRAHHFKLIDQKTEALAQYVITSVAKSNGYSPQDTEDKIWWSRKDVGDSTLNDRDFLAKSRISNGWSSEDAYLVQGQDWRSRRSATRPKYFVQFIENVYRGLCDAEAIGDIKCYVNEEFNTPPLADLKDGNYYAKSFYDMWICINNKNHNYSKSLEASKSCLMRIRIVSVREDCTGC